MRAWIIRKSARPSYDDKVEGPSTNALDQRVVEIPSAGFQRQDSLDDQLRDVADMAVLMGCYDADDWIRKHRLI